MATLVDRSHVALNFIKFKPAASEARRPDSRCVLRQEAPVSKQSKKWTVMTAPNNRRRAVRLQHVKRALAFPHSDQRPQADRRAVFALRLRTFGISSAASAREFSSAASDILASALQPSLPDTVPVQAQPRQTLLLSSRSKSRPTTYRRFNDALPVTHLPPIGAPGVRPRCNQPTASAPHRPSRHAALGPAPAQARAQPAATAAASGCAGGGTAVRRPRGRRCRRHRRRRRTAAIDSAAHRALTCPAVRGARGAAARRRLRVHRFRSVRSRSRRGSSVACE
jgi:hypothetical protein